MPTIAGIAATSIPAIPRRARSACIAADCAIQRTGRPTQNCTLPYIYRREPCFQQLKPCTIPLRRACWSTPQAGTGERHDTKDATLQEQIDVLNTLAQYGYLLVQMAGSVWEITRWRD